MRFLNLRSNWVKTFLNQGRSYWLGFTWLFLPALASASVASDMSALLDHFFGGDQTPIVSPAETDWVSVPDFETPAPEITPKSNANTLEVRRAIMQKEAELEAFEADLRDQEKINSQLQSQILTSQQQLQLVDQQIELNRRKLDFYNQQVKEWQVLVETLTREKSGLRAQIRNKERTYQSLLSKKFIQKQNFQLNPIIDWWQWIFSERSVSELFNERRQSNVNQMVQAGALASLQALQKAYDAQEKEAVTALTTISNLEAQLLKDQLVLNDLAAGKATLLSQLNDDKTLASQQLSQFRQAQADTTIYLQNLRAELLEKNSEAAVAVENSETTEPFLQWPLALPVTLSAGFKDPVYEANYGREHLGLDMIANQGTNVLAVAEGVVNKIATDSSGYSYLILQHEPDLYTIYGHISNALVAEGDIVLVGQTIAWSGGTPGTPGAGFFTSGPHLHFEVFSGGQFIDPLLLLSE